MKTVYSFIPTLWTSQLIPDISDNRNSPAIQSHNEKYHRRKTYLEKYAYCNILQLKNG